jgi:4'-phosphopantetheinyl transferase
MGSHCWFRRQMVPNLQFSLAHSGDVCLLAVGLDHAIGIDVEEVRDLPPSMDIAQSYFTPAESRALAALTGTARRDAFLLLWTHKEAMVKGLGVSLAANLGRVEFAFDAGGALRLVAWGGDQSVARRWSIRRLDTAPDCIAAVASVHPIQSLTLRDWTRTAAN